MGVYLKSILFYLGFAWRLIYFEILFRLGQVFGKPAFSQTLNSLHQSIVSLLKKTNFQISIKKETEIKKDESYLFLCNHQSMFDLCILFTSLSPSRPVFVAKQELSRAIPSISYVIKNDGSAIVDRNNPRQALGELKLLASRISQNNLSVVIFPEGTRSKDGSINQYKHAGVSALLRENNNLSIIPVYCKGPAKITNGLLKPVGFGTKISVTIGPELNQEDFKDTKELVSTAENWARSLA